MLQIARLRWASEPSIISNGNPNEMRYIYLIVAFTVIAPSVSFSEVYKWIDSKGVVQYSDKKPADVSATEVKIETPNVFGGTNRISDNAPATHRKDTFVMPSARSKVPYRFIMTSAINVDQPVDNLSSININLSQKSFSSYVYVSVERGVEYNLRFRIIDAKGELIFDASSSQSTITRSMWFGAIVSPKISIDEPGDWTIQGILNNETLFVERRRILF